MLRRLMLATPLSRYSVHYLRPSRYSVHRLGHKDPAGNLGRILAGLLEKKELPPALRYEIHLWQRDLTCGRVILSKYVKAGGEMTDEIQSELTQLARMQRRFGFFSGQPRR